MVIGTILSHNFVRPAKCHVIRWIKANPSELPSCQFHRDCGSEDIMVLVWHEISQDLVTKVSGDFIG